MESFGPYQVVDKVGEGGMGHQNIPLLLHTMIREILAWFDKYLGTVTP